MSHALERTSPTGQPFVGHCIKCGAENLGMVGALQDCPADAIVSDEEALLHLIDPPAEAKGATE